MRVNHTYVCKYVHKYISVYVCTNIHTPINGEPLCFYNVWKLLQLGIRLCRRPASLERPLQAIMSGINGMNNSSQRGHTPYANRVAATAFVIVMCWVKEKKWLVHTLPYTPISIAPDEWSSLCLLYLYIELKGSTKEFQVECRRAATKMQHSSMKHVPHKCTLLCVVVNRLE